MISLTPLGDRAFLARFASEPEAAGWAHAVREAGLLGVVDVVLAYGGVAVFADPDRCTIESLGDDLGRIVAPPAIAESAGRLIRIPVLYDGEDLCDVARSTALAIDELIEIHASPEYRVLAVGFLPGFPYLGDLGPEIAGLPRRDSPRSRVPAGSVAIAGRQTGIYPRESPGGWHLLGRTPLVIADIETGFFPIAPGDRVCFGAIGEDEYRDRLGERLAGR